MWRQIRGLGLAYHFSIFIDPDSGMIFFILSKSSNLVKGYQEGLAVVVSIYILSILIVSFGEIRVILTNLKFQKFV